MRERLVGVDFVRAVSAIGIILFHICNHSVSTFKPFSYIGTTGTLDWGIILVTVFFVMSGAMQYYNTPKIENLRSFYYKKWKNIFPMFYLAYMFFWVERFLQTKSLFQGEPWTMFLTILGMDGYFVYKVFNNYILGEWFLGAIVILYILYPIVVWMFNRNKTLPLILVGIGNVWLLNTDVFAIGDERNILSCLLSFILGMYLVEYRLYESKPVKLAALICCIVFSCVSFPIHRNVLVHIVGFSLFIILYHIGNLLMKNEYIKGVITKISSISFAIFLLQHLVITKVLSSFNPVEAKNVVIVMVFIVLLTIVYANVLQLVTNHVLSTRLFVWLDKKIGLKKK